MTFDDLQFAPQLGGSNIQARGFFPNGYGYSVIQGPYTYGGSEGLFELAVLKRGGGICYDTPITDDVLGNLSEEEVTEILRDIEALS